MRNRYKYILIIMALIAAAIMFLPAQKGGSGYGYPDGMEGSGNSTSENLTTVADITPTPTPENNSSYSGNSVVSGSSLSSSGSSSGNAGAPLEPAQTSLIPDATEPSYTPEPETPVPVPEFGSIITPVLLTAAMIYMMLRRKNL